MQRSEIIAYRQKFGLEKSQMARLLGIPYRSYANYEHGRRRAPALMRRLLDTLDMVGKAKRATILAREARKAAA